MNLISRFVVAMVFVTVFTVAGCAHTEGAIAPVTTTDQSIAEKPCFAVPKEQKRPKAEYTCNSAVVARASSMLREAMNLATINLENADAFWQTIEVLKIYGTCKTTVNFSEDFFVDMLFLSRVYSLKVVVNSWERKDCTQEYNAFVSVLPPPPRSP